MKQDGLWRQGMQIQPVVPLDTGSAQSEMEAPHQEPQAGKLLVPHLLEWKKNWHGRMVYPVEIKAWASGAG
ncbi:hypothetical protein KSZ_76290 [Dictyobacter formicarum]|uniref:Uncharacterized protein n=1 Tax=Dictyobacter formicarum TaxID=2778368 RepID=A0ABQ3VUY0_9CHLR|nr:hypothetical protein KSZ_76290 [Dictyobacter formicarum]